MSTNENTQDEKQEFTKEQHEQLLQAAFERGASEKLRTMVDFLYEVCELFAKSFKPPHGDHADFMGFTINHLQGMAMTKYSKKEEEGQVEEKRNVQEGEEASERGCEDVQEGSEGRQEADQANSKEEEQVNEES